MTTTDTEQLEVPPALAQRAELERQATAELDRHLRWLIAEHNLPVPSTTAHRVEHDGYRSLSLVVADAAAWDAWCPHIDTTGVVSPGPYPCGTEQLRVRVGTLAGITTVLIVDDALQVLRAQPGDVTLDAPRDPETTAAVTG